MRLQSKKPLILQYRYCSCGLGTGQYAPVCTDRQTSTCHGAIRIDQLSSLPGTVEQIQCIKLSQRATVCLITNSGGDPSLNLSFFAGSLKCNDEQHN